jgi:RNA polymerase sigma factor (sigma-70 family)
MMFKSTAPSNSPDRLWKRFQAGDRSAFETIYRQHYPHLYTYGRQLCRDTELLRDTIQTIFVDIWRRREGLGEVREVRFYLFRILRRQLMAHLGSKQKPGLLDPEAHFYESDPFMSEEEQEQERRIQRAVQSLSGKQREIIFLRYYENLDCEEIAGLMQININTVYNHTTAAIKKLRYQLSGQAMSFFIFIPSFLDFV